VKLVYVEELPDRTSAMKREMAIKKMKRGMKMKLIGGKEVHRETRRQVHRYTTKRDSLK